MRFMLSEKTFTTQAVRINYAQGEPNGPALLLLHGAGSVWQDWETVIAWFSEKWQVYAPDLRGCGKSGHVPRGYRISDFTEDTVAFIQQCIGTPAVIVGHSLGSMVAIKLAADYPQLVNAVVLEDPALYLDDFLEDWISYPLFPLTVKLATAGLGLNEIKDRYLGQPGVDEAEALKLARSTLQIDTDLLIQIMDRSAWQGFDTDVLLGRITCPLLLLYGEMELGSALRPEDLKRAQRYLPGARMQAMAGLGHGLHTAAPAAFNKAVADFLNGV